jgi:hypothetical protein
MRPSDYRIGVDEKGVYAYNRRTGESTRKAAFVACFCPATKEAQEARYEAARLLDESEAFGGLMLSSGRISGRNIFSITRSIENGN